MILSFIKNVSYLSHDEDISETHFLFSTRVNGSVGDEDYGEEDYTHAIDVKKKLLKEFNDITVEIETIDEWVTLNVFINNS